MMVLSELCTFMRTLSTIQTFLLARRPFIEDRPHRFVLLARDHFYSINFKPQATSKGGLMGSMPACDPRGPSVNPALGKLVKQIFLSVSCIVDFLAKQYFNCCFSLRQSCYKENNTVHKLWYPHGHYICHGKG